MSPLSQLDKKLLQSPLIQISAVGKIAKAIVVYVHIPDTDYRCSDCWKFIPETLRCAELGLSDVVLPQGYCELWSYGSPIPGLQPLGCYRPEQVGYGEDPRGTKCRRCVNYDNGYCKVVDEASAGDDPGRIDPNACCNAQEPRYV